MMTVHPEASATAKDFAGILPTLQNQFIDAYNRRDLADVLDFYAEDGYVVRPNKDIVRGREAIREHHARRMLSGQRFVSMTTLSVVADAATAIEITDAVIELSDHIGRPVRETSRIVAIWKCQPDRSWKLDADVFV